MMKIKHIRKAVVITSMLVCVVSFLSYLGLQAQDNSVLDSYGHVLDLKDIAEDYTGLGANNSKVNTQVVMFVPSPVAWHDRRRNVYLQFVKEGWTEDQAVLLFVFGKRGQDDIQKTGSINSSGVTDFKKSKNVFVNCRDYGDAFNRPDDSSATTCKVYKAIRYIVAHYNALYVWRGADDSYINLPFFFRDVIHTLPTSRLYLGRLRNPLNIPFGPDLILPFLQPKLASLFGLFQFGQYMLGGGYLLSFDVADFIASLKIPPHLTWCEDVMVGMWLNPFQVTFMHTPFYHEQWVINPAMPGVDYLVIHYMRPEQWDLIDGNGRLM